MSGKLTRAAILLAFIVNQTQPVYAFGFSIPAPLPGENQSIDIAGSTVRVKGLTNQANKVFINKREAVIQKDGSFTEDIIIPLGDTEMTVEAVAPDGTVKSYKKTIKAKADNFFMAGIADGTLNFSDASEGFKLRRDSKSFDNGLDADGKVSYYATGKLRGKYLFKSAIDTDKQKQEKLFTYIDPDKYYPIYGDNSTVVYDVNSQGKFYGLFEWEKSGAVIGNYQTQIGEKDSDLISYNRTLYGAKAHLETPNRTVYGDAVHKSDFFIAAANQHAGHSELLGTGGSLYYFRHRNIVEGSEQVRLEVRDKVTGMTIRSIPQTQADYEIKYDEGRILFKRPVLSVADSDTLITTSILEGNPVYVVANYEYKSQEAFPVELEDLNNRAGGVRVSQHLGDHIRGGITYIQEQKDESSSRSHRLVGGDTTVKLGNFTNVNLQAAQSEADSTNSYISYDGGYNYISLTNSNPGQANGRAMKISANSALGEYFGKGKEFLDVSGFWQKIGHDFAPVDTLFEAGSVKYGFDAAHRISKNDTIRGVFEKIMKESGEQGNPAVENQVQAASQRNVTAQWNHTWEKFTFTTEYSHRDEKDNYSPIYDPGKGRVKGHLAAERVQYDLNNKTTLFLGQQFGLSDMNDSFTSAGLRRQLTDTFSVNGQAGAGPMGNSVTAGFEKVMGPFSSVYSNHSLIHSDIDGRTSITSFGTNTAISENAKLRRERQFMTSDTRGVYGANLIGYENQITPELSFDFDYQRRDETQNTLSLTTPEARDATSASIAYVKPDFFKGYSKAEYRLNSDNLWQLVSDTQGELKVTRDIFLFGEYEYSRAEESVVSLIDKKEAGLAFRPVDYDWFNALFKFIHLTDGRPENLTSPDGGFTVTNSNNNEIATEFAVDTPWRFQFVEKMAGKKEDILAVNTTGTIETPDKLWAFLWIHRLNYHLTKKVDIAAEYRNKRLLGDSIHQKDNGFLFETTYEVIKHMAVGVGFNFTEFTDDLLSKDNSSARGFFLRLQGKY